MSFGNGSGHGIGEDWPQRGEIAFELIGDLPVEGVDLFQKARLGGGGQLVAVHVHVDPGKVRLNVSGHGDLVVLQRIQEVDVEIQFLERDVAEPVDPRFVELVSQQPLVDR
jgi:hypothetical protein